MSAKHLVWFKKDLRIHDHKPLLEASKQGQFICAYIYEPEIIGSEEYDSSHHGFLNESLKELQESLRQRGSELYLVYGPVVESLIKIRAVFPFDILISHMETGNALTYERDKQVAKWAKAENIAWKEHSGYGVIRGLDCRDGWASEWNKKMRRKEKNPQDAFKQAHPSVKLPTHILSHKEVGIPPDTKRLRQFGGESNALKTLESFLSERGQFYRKEMSSPLTGWDACSRLSAYLSFGCISIRRVHQQTTLRQQQIRSMAPKPAGWAPSLSSFQGRLRWHCHFMQKLEDEPEIEFENMNRAFDGLREEDFNQEFFEAYCKGETGYPLVDACMRALHQGGWINFRMRGMLASFSAYHLWLHWRKPAIHLAKHFLDFEAGIHFSQIQMQSGVTGINSIRIYSPIKQVLDQDPDGEFIKRFVPELEGVPKKYIAEPHLMPSDVQHQSGCIIGKTYPKPIVEHIAAYKEARSRIYSWKNRPEVKAASKLVYEKHGSRKNNSQSKKT